MGWNYLSIPKLQRCNRWSLGIDKLFHPIHYNGCNYLSMLGLKLNHVSKRGPRSGMGAVKHIFPVLLISTFVRVTTLISYQLPGLAEIYMSIRVWLEGSFSCLYGMKISLLEKIRNGAFVTPTHGNVTQRIAWLCLKWTAIMRWVATQLNWTTIVQSRIIWAIGCLAKGMTVIQKR